MATQRLTSRRRQDQGSKWVRIVMAVLATIGVIDTGSITLKFWGVLGNLTCPMGAGGCDKVLNSPWGTLVQGDGFSIPLSFAGLMAYLAVLVMAVVPLLPGLSENKADLSRRTWWGLFTVSLVMAVFSLVLVGLMVIKIQAFLFFLRSFGGSLPHLAGVVVGRRRVGRTLSTAVSGFPSRIGRVAWWPDLGFRFGSCTS
jgi:uncharacterized membrane protein